MRSPDSEPDLAEFQYHLEAAMACSIITCTAWNAEVQRALDAVRDAAPNPPKGWSTPPWMPSWRKWLTRALGTSSTISGGRIRKFAQRGAPANAVGALLSLRG